MHRKKPVQEIDRSLLQEPEMSSGDWRDFEEGISLFNARNFWHAHEAWETVWKRHPEESRIFFQGLIQLAAAYHLILVSKRYGGAVQNLAKAEEKLRLFPGRFLRLDVFHLVDSIIISRQEIARIGKDRMDTFQSSLVPTIVFL